MTMFEFLMALASVVIAIALTEIFAGWRRLLRTHIVPRLDWLHLAWTLVIVLYAIQYWVGIWPYREIQFTYIYQVWFLIFPTLFIVLVSYAITPDIDPDTNLDLRDYYLSRRTPIFIGLAAFIATAQHRGGMKLFFSLSLLFAISCTHAAETPDLTGTTEKGLTVEIYSELSPLRINQIHSWHVRILDGGRKTLAVEKLQLIGGMPEHDHGLPTQPQITATLDNGDYLLEGVRFHMQGLWLLEIDLQHDGSEDSASIEFVLQ